MANGKWLDCSEPLDTAQEVSAIKDAGYNGVVRYIASPRWHNYHKRLTVPEKKLLEQAGLEIRLCYETTATNMLGGENQAKEDIKEVLAALAELNFSFPPIVYFAADWDCQPSQYSIIAEYLHGIGTHSNFIRGLYGKSALLDWIHTQPGFPPYALWQAAGWRYGYDSPYADLRQTAVGVVVGGIQTDTDILTVPDTSTEPTNTSGGLTIYVDLETLTAEVITRT